MSLTETDDLLRLLRKGALEPVQGACFDDASLESLLDELRERYPIAFQERRVGRKREIGLARRVSYEFGEAAVRRSPFSYRHLDTVLRDCLFLSGYDDEISELATASSLSIRLLAGDADALTLSMRRGYKLDRTPDGWRLEPVRSRRTRLSKASLKSRGWNFDALFPAGAVP